MVMNLKKNNNLATKIVFEIVNVTANLVRCWINQLFEKKKSLKP